VGQFTATVEQGEPQYEFEWTANGNLIGSGDILEYQSDETTAINCLVTDACGLTDEATVTLFIDNPPIEVTHSADTAICLGSQITLTVNATGGAGALWYDWSGPQLSSDDTQVSVSPGAPATYEIVVGDQCAQEVVSEIEVDVQDVSAGFTLTYLSETEVEFTAESMADCEDCIYTWDFGDGITSDIPNPTHTFDGLAQYQVMLQVMNSIGCYEYAFSVVYPPLELYVPNAFTPDGDGINDVFQVYGMGILEFEMIIFNRWGDIVYRSENLEQAWTGNADNGDYFVPDGVYTYLIKYQGVSKEAEEITGQITLMR
jgi:gliding motility-associated-like protein